VALVLPEDDPLTAELDALRIPWRRRSAPESHAGPLRVGIINVMPQVETYEPYLLRPLGSSQREVEPVFIRLESHGYTSSDSEHVARRYLTYARAVDDAPLDGVILTGAPVEELPFDEVRYFRELSALLDRSSAAGTSTLGLCWGGLALAGLLGIPKTTSPGKIFGVFENRTLASPHPLSEGFDDVFWCAHSRHSGITDRTLEDAAARGIVRLLSHGDETGYSIFETPDHSAVMHLGHPEYDAARLVHEWRRDRALDRADVLPPAHFDPERPVNRWRSHGLAFFGNWLALLRGSRTA
jgi:homoserine O-succinyltransferase